MSTDALVPELGAFTQLSCCAAHGFHTGLKLTGIVRQICLICNPIDLIGAMVKKYPRSLPIEPQSGSVHSAAPLRRAWRLRASLRRISLTEASFVISLRAPSLNLLCTPSTLGKLYRDTFRFQHIALRSPALNQS